MPRLKLNDLEDTGHTSLMKCVVISSACCPQEVDKGSTAAQTLASSASLISLALPGLSSEISMEQLFSMDWVTMAADCWEPPHCLALTASCSAGVLYTPGRDPVKACKEGRGRA